MIKILMLKFMKQINASYMGVFLLEIILISILHFSDTCFCI